MQKSQNMSEAEPMIPSGVVADETCMEKSVVRHGTVSNGNDAGKKKYGSIPLSSIANRLGRGFLSAFGRSNSSEGVDKQSSVTLTQARAKKRWEKLRRRIPDVLEANDNSLVHDTDHPEYYRDGRGIAESASNFLEIRLTHCFAAIALYLLFGAIFFSYLFDHWTIVDSLYFSVVTFTTVGYGDLFPNSSEGRIFTVFFSLVGISALGIALGVIGDNIIESRVKQIEEVTNKTKEFVKDLLLHDENGEVKMQDDRTAKTSDISEGENEDRGKCGIVLSILRKYLPTLVVLIAASLFIAWCEGWDPTDGLYYCFMTMTTVGYGDLAPSTTKMRLFAIFYIPVAVGAMGKVLGNVADYVMDRRLQAFVERLQTRELRFSDLTAMDHNEDGTVTRLEYVEFMLKSMQIVDPALLEKLNTQFDRLDVDGSGKLDKNDLRMMARKRLQRGDKKLALSLYKKSLMEKSQLARKENTYITVNEP